MDVDAALASLCHRIEALAPHAVAGMTFCSADGSVIERALFPSLPASFAGAIRDVSLAEPHFGSCVKSVATGQIVTCSDIANDPRFDPQWKQLCLDHGLRSLQSRPIVVKGRPSGTFVLAYREQRDESEWDAALMSFAADAAGAKLQTDFASA
jgi:GAF domain-containing protein